MKEVLFIEKKILQKFSGKSQNAVFVKVLQKLI